MDLLATPVRETVLKFEFVITERLMSKFTIPGEITLKVLPSFLRKLVITFKELHVFPMQVRRQPDRGIRPIRHTDKFYSRGLFVALHLFAGLIYS